MLATTLVVLGALAAAPALAQNGGRTGGASLPHIKAAGESLTYDGFTNFNCTQGGFTVDATAHFDIQGDAAVSGVTTLDGAPYDTFNFPLTDGPDTFTTLFSRVFTPPPPGSSSYVFVFRAQVSQGIRRIGTSVTTITCTNGLLSAVNVWTPNGEPIPAGGPAAWLALALLLAASAALRLSTRRA
ncbi:MAG TPA: hypothetical protein VII68_03275 [Casimicrobiaceae bacterium]